MAINYDSFLNWCIDRFGEENLRFRKNGEEICTHSHFADEDKKYKLYMNPTGGSRNLEAGAYRCWKTDEMGSLVTLVSDYDNIPYEQAAEMICDGAIPLRALEIKVNQFFQNKKSDLIDEEVEVKSDKLELPPNSIKISDSTGHYGMKAREYLKNRKLPIDDLYFCFQGDYKNRIIIPYYDKTGKLVFYNARTMSDNPKVLRYMKPLPEIASQSNVLFCSKWPKPGSKIYITEGEFDAIALSSIGFPSVACGGKFISDSQIELLRDYNPVLAFDSDEAGFNALTGNGDNLLQKGFSKISYIRPPEVYKDWNKLLQNQKVESIRAYISKYEKEYNSWTSNELKALII